MNLVTFTKEILNVKLHFFVQNFMARAHLFYKTREIFPSVTRVLSIFLTTAATAGASVERVNSKERVTKVPCPIPAASYPQR